MPEQIGGPLYGELRELVNQATAWNAQDKAALRAAGEEILVFIGAKGNKKAKELLRLIE